tara:strand:- start:1426 stop:1998 length:573 start_codon:yes stop_codon:yes gene_type:complete
MKKILLSYGVLKDKNLKEKVLFNLFKELEYNKLFLNHLKNNVDKGTLGVTIHSMNKAKVVGPVFINPQLISLSAVALQHKENKFYQLKNGKIKKYFRENNFTDLENIDFSKLPPIIVRKDRILIDGAHRTFLAKKFNKKIKAFVLEEKKENSKFINEMFKIILEFTKNKIQEDKLKDYIPYIPNHSLRKK